jgi:hypothetical protein
MRSFATASARMRSTNVLMSISCADARPAGSRKENSARVRMGAVEVLKRNIYRQRKWGDYTSKVPKENLALPATLGASALGTRV